MGFEFVEPASVEEAVALLAGNASSMHLIAGGTDLMLRIRLRQVSPRVVVGIGRLPELARVEATPEGGLRIGAAATLSAIARSPAVRRNAPILADVCGSTRSPQLRTLATLGGILCAASPLAEPPLALLALGATLRLHGPTGVRDLALDDFLVGPGRTALRPGEILTDVLVAPAPLGAAAAYDRLSRREALEPPLVACAAVLAAGADGTCRLARVALGAATPRPMRLPEVEAALLGGALTPERVAAAARLAALGDLTEDVRASPAYRRRVAAVVVGRALARAEGVLAHSRDGSA